MFRALSLDQGKESNQNSQTVVVGIGAYFMLPNTLGTASFLKEDERSFAVTRLRNDVPSRISEDGR